MLRLIKEGGIHSIWLVIVGVCVFTVLLAILIVPLVSVQICGLYDNFIGKEIIAGMIDVLVFAFWCILLKRPVRQLLWIKKLQSTVDKDDEKSGDGI
jgi:hypothetical protein